MIVSIGFLLLVSLVVSAALAALGKWWGPMFGAWETVLQIVNVIVSFGFITVLFALVYRILPRVKVAWNDVWIGAAVTTLRDLEQPRRTVETVQPTITRERGRNEIGPNEPVPEEETYERDTPKRSRRDQSLAVIYPRVARIGVATVTSIAGAFIIGFLRRHSRVAARASKQDVGWALGMISLKLSTHCRMRVVR